MRSYLDPRCLKEPAVKEVVWRISTILILMSQVLDSLLAWLNTSLADSRVRLMELEDDLKDVDEVSELLWLELITMMMRMMAKVTVRKMAKITMI